MSARPRRPERYQIQPTARLPGRAPARRSGPSRYPHHPRNRRNHGCGMIFLTSLILLLLAVGGAGYYLYSKWQDSLGNVVKQRPNQTDAGDQPHDIATQPFNMLLVGVDSRSASPEDGARSDTLILVRVDPVNQWASMLSIPRDTYAYIPRVDTYEKINAAYSRGYSNAEALFGTGTEPEMGGVTLAAEAVEQFLDLQEKHNSRIHYYAQIDFEGFQRIIDAIGGIVVDVQKPLLDPQYPSDDGDNGYIRLYVPAGLQHMDGTTALRYARSRHQDNDFGRAQRQQQVLRAILQSLKERGLLDQIQAGNAVLNELQHMVSTDLPVDEIPALRALAKLASALTGDRIVSYTLNSQVVPAREQADASIIWDEAALDQLVARWLSGPPPAVKQADVGEDQPVSTLPRVQVFNGARVNGLAGEVSNYLQGQGFEMLAPSNADRTYDNSLLIDYTDHPLMRQQLADLLGINSKYIKIQPEADEAPPKPDGADIVLILGLDYHEDWRGAGRP